MIGRIRQRRPLVSTTALFTIGIGVVGADAPGRCELPLAGQFDALGHGFIDVDVPADGLLVVEADQVIAVGGNTHLCRYFRGPGVVAVVTAGGLDLVLELVMEQRQVGIEVGQVVIVDAEFGIGADLRVEVGIAHGGLFALVGNAVQSRV